MPTGRTDSGRRGPGLGRRVIETRTGESAGPDETDARWKRSSQERPLGFDGEQGRSGREVGTGRFAGVLGGAGRAGTLGLTVVPMRS